MPDAGIPTVQPLDGKTTIDDKMLFEPERLSYEAATDLANRIAALLPDPGQDPKRVLICDVDFLSDLANLVAVRSLLKTLLDDYLSIGDRGRRLSSPAPNAGPEREGLDAVPLSNAVMSVLPPIGPIATVATGLNTLLGIASLFRQDVSFSGVKTAVDGIAFEIEVAARVKARGYQNVLIPDFFITPSHVDGEDSFRSLLAAVETAKTGAWQEVSPLMGRLVELDTTLDQAARAGDQAEVDRLRSEIGTLRLSLSPISDPLARVDQQFSRILTDLQKSDSATGLTGLGRLLRAESIQALDPVFLHVKVVSSGGHNKTTRSLLRTLFSGDGLTFMGGAVVRWALLNKDGSFQAGGILSARRAGDFR